MGSPGALGTALSGRRRDEDRHQAAGRIHPASTGARRLRFLPTIASALKAGSDVSITVRLDSKVKTVISSIPNDAWTTIENTAAVCDEQASRWVSRAEVAEIPFTGFAAQKKTNQRRR